MTTKTTPVRVQCKGTFGRTSCEIVPAGGLNTAWRGGERRRTGGRTRHSRVDHPGRGGGRGFTMVHAAAQLARVRDDMTRVQEQLHREIRHWQDEAAAEKPRADCQGSRDVGGRSQARPR